jgi:hypothetical protein
MRTKSLMNMKRFSNTCWKLDDDPDWFETARENTVSLPRSSFSRHAVKIA